MRKNSDCLFTDVHQLENFIVRQFDDPFPSPERSQQFSASLTVDEAKKLKAALIARGIRVVSNNEGAAL